MSSNDRWRLQHMLEAATEALSFAEGKSKNDLIADRLLVLGLTREIEIIGEAASKVSAECRAHPPEIPWPVVIGIRNRLIHAYFEVDLDVVWSTVISDLPELVRELDKALAGDREETSPPQ